MTLIEIMVVVLVSAMVLYTLAASVRASVGTYRASAGSMSLEAHGSRAMRNIVEALRGTDADLIATLPQAPFSSPVILYQDVLPFDGKIAAPSAPKTVALVGDSVVWTESPGTTDERSATWCDGVPALLDGETLDGNDDNGNGLIDETGLCFVRDGTAVRVWLTLSDDDGNTRTWSTTVVCRN